MGCIHLIISIGGGITNNDWDYFTRPEEIKKRISKLTTPGILYKGTGRKILEPANHAVRDRIQNRYYEIDLKNKSELGLNAGLEWSRIEAEESTWNEEAINHYRKMISFMLEKDLEPITTLNHFTLPL